MKKINLTGRLGFWADAFFGTVFIFVIMYGAVRLFSALDFLDPVGDAIADTELTDIVFSQMRTDPRAEERILIVNIGPLSRAGMAREIEILSKYEPKCIGLDVMLPYVMHPVEDSLMAAALANFDNFVLARTLVYEEDTNVFSLIEPIPPFAENTLPGFVNFITTVTNQDQFKAVRTFPSQESTVNGEMLAFALALTQLYDSAATQEFLDRDLPYEIINFRGNTIDFFGDGEFAGKFITLDWEDVLDENFEPDIVKDKIVLMGYLGDQFGDRSWEDKLFTPLNKNYAGKTNPDMYGVVVHANIASMVLNKDYINQMGKVSSTFWGVLICFLNVALFSLIYKKMDRWYDGLTKLIQFSELILLFGLIILVFNQYSYKLDLTLAIVCIALAGDALEVYYGVVKNLFSAEGRKELFGKKKNKKIES